MGEKEAVKVTWKEGDEFTLPCGSCKKGKPLPNCMRKGAFPIRKERRTVLCVWDVPTYSDGLRFGCVGCVFGYRDGLYNEGKCLAGILDDCYGFFHVVRSVCRIRLVEHDGGRYWIAEDAQGQVPVIVECERGFAISPHGCDKKAMLSMPMESDSGVRTLGSDFSNAIQKWNDWRVEQERSVGHGLL